MPNNLKNTEATQFRSGSEQAEISRKGGIASGKARRLKGSLRQIASKVADMPMSKKTIQKMIRSGVIDPDMISEKDLTNGVAVVLSIYRGAMNGDSKMAKLLLELMQEQETEVNQNVSITFSKAEKSEES